MDAKKGKTRRESTPIKVWVTPEEKDAIAAKADVHSLSASSYLRRLGLVCPCPPGLTLLVYQRALGHGLDSKLCRLITTLHTILHKVSSDFLGRSDR
jgi:hypothetical protein